MRQWKHTQLIIHDDEVYDLNVNGGRRKVTVMFLKLTHGININTIFLHVFKMFFHRFRSFNYIILFVPFSAKV